MRRRNRENEAGNSQGMFYAEHVVCSLGATEGFAQLRCRVPAMRWQSSKTPTHLNNSGFVLPNTCVTTLKVSLPYRSHLRGNTGAAPK